MKLWSQGGSMRAHEIGKSALQGVQKSELKNVGVTRPEAKNSMIDAWNILVLISFRLNYSHGNAMWSLKLMMREFCSGLSIKAKQVSVPKISQKISIWIKMSGNMNFSLWQKFTLLCIFLEKFIKLFARTFWYFSLFFSPKALYSIKMKEGKLSVSRRMKKI